MVLHAYCVASGGIPLFCRSSGTEISPMFTELAPLNGIQVFGKVHSASFQSTKGKDFTVHWKSFTEKLSLILISKRSVSSNGEFILNCIFDAMVLTVGVEELSIIRHVDRLKKELRPCYSIIDKILKSVDETCNNENVFSILSMVEVMPCHNSNILQQTLHEWSESISSLFCCLTIKDKIVVATSAWWDLTAIEKNLLSIIVAVNNNCTTTDIPVFLPVKSPKVAFRLVSCCLMADVWVSALCGPAPSLTEFEQSVLICWSPVAERLKEIRTNDPRIVPEHFSIQNGVIGLLLINYVSGKYIILGTVAENEIHLDSLRIFYYQNIEELLKENERNTAHCVRETFWYSENYKLYGIVTDENIFCLMTSSVVPTPTARSISKDLFTSVTNGEIFPW